ncbi:MAG: ankyrin repeat domain-containing protein [Flavobacterium sp.]|nr:ankyrin repeat domain-containing protein [Flavobacterium sp.]
MRKFLILVFVLVTSTVFSQTTLDVFELGRKGTVDQVNEVLKSNPKVFNVVNSDGYSPLVLACYRANNEVAKILINSGSDINELSKFGTPLMACIVKNNNEIAKLLVEKKANLDSADPTGMTALIYATNFRNYEMVSVLVKAGANVDYKDIKKSSALDYAIVMNDDKLIELLKNKNKKP